MNDIYSFYSIVWKSCVLASPLSVLFEFYFILPFFIMFRKIRLCMLAFLVGP